MPEKPLGQVAYEACQKYLAENATAEHAHIIDAEEWADLPQVYVEAWMSAAEAISDELGSAFPNGVG